MIQLSTPTSSASKPRADVGVGGRSKNVDLDQADPAAAGAVDDADAAPGQARVDAQDPHATLIERMFGSLAAAAPVQRNDAPRALPCLCARRPAPSHGCFASLVRP